MIAVGLLPGCAPVPTELAGSSDGTADASTGPASTSATPTPGSTSAEDPEMSGSGGQGADTSSDGDTTAGVQLGTSTGETASTGPTTTGEEPGSSSGSPPPSCDELYGAAPGYLLCMETPDECHFAAATNGGNCNAMCSMFQGTCIDAFDNSAGCTVLVPNLDDCTTNRGTEICVCSRQSAGS